MLLVCFIIKKITFNYETNNNKKEKYSFKVNIIDTTPPVILSNSTYEIEKGKKFNISSSPLCGDNYDRNIKCERKPNRAERRRKWL